MASDGLTNTAKKGKCRMCLRVRDTLKYLKIVGEVRHGYATGHIWECIDVKDCERAAHNKINDKTRARIERETIKFALKQGRYNRYKIFN